MLEVAVSKCNVDSVSEVLQDRPLRLSFIPSLLVMQSILLPRLCILQLTTASVFLPKIHFQAS